MDLFDQTLEIASTLRAEEAPTISFERINVEVRAYESLGSSNREYRKVQF